MGSLAGRVALVTGAGRGIGREEALYFAAQGADVVVNDPGLSPDGTVDAPGIADDVVAEIRAAGGRAVANTDRVDDWAGAERMVRAAVEAFGDLHVVVNNATLHRTRALTAMTEAEFDDVIAVKLKGTFAVSGWVARYWRDEHRASRGADRAIVNTTSGGGLFNPLPAMSNYASANAGAAAMTLVHALELERYGVRVNAIAPSMVRTRLTEDVPGLATSDAQAAGEYDAGHPIHQAVVAGFLGSADCRLTGQVLAVNGGTVTLAENWARGRSVERGDRAWNMDELADALSTIPITHPLDHLASQIGGALGSAGRERLMAMFDAVLDDDALPPPGGSR